MVVLLACPFVISLGQLPVRTTGVGLGFSGLVLSWYGYASLVFVGYLATRLTTGVHLDHAPRLFVGQLAVVAFLAPTGRTARIGAVGASLAVAGIYAVSGKLSVWGPGGLLDPDARRAGYLEPAAITAVVGIAFLLVGFSGGRVSGATVDGVSHVVGFTSGFLVSYVLLRTDCALSHVYHCAGPAADCELHDSLLTRWLRWVLLRVWL